MDIRKGLRIAVVTAATMAVWAGAGKDNAKAAVTAGDIEASGEEQKLYVNSANDKELMFGIAKKGKKSGKTVFKVSAWDVYETSGNGRVSIDLAKLSNIRENFAAVKTDDMEVPLIIRFPAVPKSTVATYNGALQELELKAGANKAGATAVSSYEWRTSYGSWHTPGTAEQLVSGKVKGVFKEFQYQGAVLYLRTPGAKLAKVTETADTSLKTVYYSEDTSKTVTVYDAGKLPGKEAKLNIAKQANGPFVSVQYKTGTLTLPKSSEYRVVTVSNGITTIPDGVIKNQSVKKGVTVTELLASDAIEKGVLEVRVEKKESKKKPASKWTRIQLEKPASLDTSGTDTIKAKPASPTNGLYQWGGAGIKDVKIMAPASGSVLVKAEYEANNKGVYSIVLTSTSDSAYQIVIMDKEEMPSASAKTRSLRAKSTLKLSGLKDGQVVYIRKTGNNKTKTWAGRYTKFGTVDFPKTEKAT